MPGRARRPAPDPVEVDPVRVVAVGTGLFSFLVVGLLVELSWLRAHHHVWWLWTAIAGLLLGLLGLTLTLRRRSRLDTSS